MDMKQCIYVCKCIIFKDCVLFHTTLSDTHMTFFDKLSETENIRKNNNI